MLSTSGTGFGYPSRGAKREPDSRRSARPQPSPAAGALAVTGPSAGPEGARHARGADPAGATAAQSCLGHVPRRLVVGGGLVVVRAAALEQGRLGLPPALVGGHPAVASRAVVRAGRAREREVLLHPHLGE